MTIPISSASSFLSRPKRAPPHEQHVALAESASNTRDHSLRSAWRIPLPSSREALQNGGYLESYLSLPCLTRASAALTCNRTAFT
jgi:hypothetical protein